ncbi:hypothetical protein EDB89DRAFT_1906390 [Lactarius sanguifluus]|nr:hypothetical protein EDB89DRAFT_1906390 [Lactarius sanguifluus]
MATTTKASRAEEARPRIPNATKATSDDEEDVPVKPAPRTLTVAGGSAVYYKHTDESRPLEEGDTEPSPLARDTDVISHEDEEGSDDEEALGHTDCKKLDKNASSSHARASRMAERHRRAHAAMAMGGETFLVEETHSSIQQVTTDHDFTDDEEASRREDSQRTMGPVHRAERYCQTLGPLMNDKRNDAISRYLMEGRWTDEEEEEDAAKGPAHQMLMTTETGMGGRRQREIKDRRHHDSTEVLEEEMGPTVVTTLVHMPGPIRLPNTWINKMLILGDTLDDEELWDAFMQDDQEEMLSQLPADDDANDNTPEESDTRFTSHTYNSNDEYDIPPLREHDNEASDIEEGERDHTRPLEHGGHHKHLLRESDDGEAQHHILPFIDEGQYDVPPLVEEGHDKSDIRKEIMLEWHDHGGTPYTDRMGSPSHDLGMARGQPPRTRDLGITLFRGRTSPTSHDLKGNECNEGWEGQLETLAEEDNSDSTGHNARHTPDAGITYTQDL